MNIHFTDENLFQVLIESSIFSIRVGSAMYGTNIKDSDVDILVIYPDGILNYQGITRTHHQLQFKDTQNNIDYIFCTIQQFINNTLSGDSTINFEVINSLALRDNKMLGYLYKNPVFFNYNIIKSYLGLAERDYKSLKKEFTPKKLMHFVRGVIISNYLINRNDLNFLDSNLMRIIKQNSDDLIDVRLNSTKDDYRILYYYNMLRASKTELNRMLDAKEITKGITAEDAHDINKFLFNLCSKEEYQEKQQHFINYGNIIEKGHYENDMGY